MLRSTLLFLGCLQNLEALHITSKSKQITTRKSFIHAISTLAPTFLLIRQDQWVVQAANSPLLAVVSEPEAPVILLFSILQVKVLLQDAVDPRSPEHWKELQAILKSPPITDSALPAIERNGRGNTRRRIPLVGNLFRKSTQQYEAALAYRVVAPNARGGDLGAFLGPDQKLPSAETVIRADLDLRDLYRNEVLEHLQEMDAELDYLVMNFGGSVPSIQSPLPDTASESIEDFEVARRKALRAFDSYLAKIPPRDVAAAESLAVVKTRKSYE